MTEIFDLRKNPELKIILNEYGIEIIDASQLNKRRTFLFNDIINIELKAKKTDWFITSLSWILDWFITSLSWILDLLISGGGGGNKYKNDANLKLETVNQTLKVWLTNVNFNEAERITKLIKNKITV